jgi:hypothetical protein
MQRERIGGVTNGGWRLAAGGWRLAAGGWRLAAGGQACRGPIRTGCGQAGKGLYQPGIRT